MLDILLNIFALVMFSLVIYECKKQGIEDWQKKCSIFGIMLNLGLLIFNIYNLFN